MNQSFDNLPDACDVLVVGAGPAGSAAAILLAQAGLDVRLVDQHAFPRDKTCGDALIADTHAALSRLGLCAEVLALAQPASHVGLVGPRGRRLDVPSTLAVLPRRQLDERLCQAAVHAGAHMHAPARFETPRLDAAGTVTGAWLNHQGARRAIASRTVILATGASVPPLLAAGVCRRRTPSGMALRAYVSHPGLAQRMNRLEVIWHPRLRGGYGWMFPAPGGMLNIGVGWFHPHGGDSESGDRRVGHSGSTLHERFQALREVHAGVREALDGGRLQGPPKGAPLRCTLQGAHGGRPGLLVAGEAVGSTYLLTGEGIGKAMETGMLAAEAVLRERAGATPAHLDYEQRLGELRPRFRLYAQANRVNAHPWLADLVIWRGNHSARLRDRMRRVLDETANPGNLLSWKGATRLLFG
jgi:geranylgeranyl reductase family protein